ncbi:MAG: M23 family metallopeptidase [Rikenellaceae bacterium]|nr:M23 family metallopeptidase [Rikenellaceae bacterium]
MKSSHEEKNTSKRRNRYNILRQVLIGFIVISLLNMAISYLFYTPKMHRIAAENRELVLKYEILQDRIASMHSQIKEIRHRDRYVYRPLFSSDTLAIEGVYTPYPNSKYSSLAGDEYSELMTSTWQSLDAVTRETYATSRSLDELQILAKDKEQMSLAIPAIWPIDRTRLKAFYAFGVRRKHPILKIRTMHKGVDMSTDYGVPVYATGDGVIEKVDKGRRRRGYGQQIVINHKFGYKTRYAHLQKMFVKPGEKVQRGQLIGEVGSTGGSTGPHLHYEVIYLGRNVNPVNYFNRNMTSDEYRQLIENTKYNSDLETLEGTSNEGA